MSRKSRDRALRAKLQEKDSVKITARLEELEPTPETVDESVALFASRVARAMVRGMERRIPTISEQLAAAPNAE